MTCPVCNDPVTRRRAKYCSDSCRWRAKDERERRNPESDHGHEWVPVSLWPRVWVCANEGCSERVEGELSVERATRECESEEQEAA